MLLPIQSKMEIFARVYSKSMDVAIKMGPRFATNGKDIFVPPIMDQTDEWIRFETEVCVYHETGHIKTDDFPTFNEIKNGAKRSIFNAVRDVCVEKTMQEEYKGLKKKWDSFLSRYVKEHTNDSLANPQISAFQKLTWIVYLRARELQNDCNYGLIVPKDIEEIYQKLLARFEKDLAFKNNTIKDSQRLTEKIFKVLKEAQQEEPKQDPKKSKSSKQKPDKNQKPENGEDSDDSEESKPEDSDDSEESKPEDSDDSEESKPEDSDDSEGSKPEDSDDSENEESKPEDNDDSENEESKPEDSDDSNGDSEPEDGDMDNESQKTLKDIQDEIEKGNEVDTVNDEIQNDVNDYVSTNKIYRETPGLTETVIPVPEIPSWRSEVAHYEQYGHEITGFMSSKMKILFVSEKAPVMHRHLTHGRLDARNLWKMDYSNELFKKRTPSIYEDSAIYIVCDHSGSMLGTEKAVIAQSFLTSLGTDMDRMNIPFAALGFTCTGPTNQALNDQGIRTDPIIINKIKDFEEPYRSVKHRFVWPANSNYTAELPAIRYATERLALRKETKKILFILSDGVTETQNRFLTQAMKDATKEYIARIKKAGIKVVTIGILDCHAKYYDPDTIVITDLKVFASTFYSQLTKILL